jgi:hypothetical protein
MLWRDTATAAGKDATEWRSYANACWAWIQEERQENRDWASRYEALVDKLAALKKEGYGPPVTLPIPEPEPVEALPAVVRRAINERASKGSVAWRHLERQAREKIGLGVDVAAVAELILNGEPVEW